MESRTHRKQDLPPRARRNSAELGRWRESHRRKAQHESDHTTNTTSQKEKESARTHRSAAADVPEEIHGRIGTFAWKKWPPSGPWEFFRRNEPLGPDLQQKTCVKTNYFRTYHRSPNWCGKLTRYCTQYLTGTVKSLATAETKQASKFPTHLEACLLFTASARHHSASKNQSYQISVVRHA